MFQSNVCNNNIFILVNTFLYIKTSMMNGNFLFLRQYFGSIFTLCTYFFLCIKVIFKAGHILPSYPPTFFDKTNEPDFRLDFCKCYMEVHDGVYIIL